MSVTKLVLIALVNVVLAACVSGKSPTTRVEGCELHFHVTPHYNAVPRALDVSVTFPSGGRSETYLRLTPSWAGVNDFSTYLSGWRGESPESAVEPTELPHRIRVFHPISGLVRVDFKARGELADPDDGKPQDNLQQYRTQIGVDWFQFFGYAVFPSVEPYGDDSRVDMCVTVHQPGPDGTPLFGSYFPGRGNDMTRHLTGSPGLLRHAFYGGGPGWRVAERHLTSGTVGVAMRGHFGAEDIAFVDKAAALIDAQRRFWNDETSRMQWIVIAPNYTQYSSGGTLVNQAAVLYGNKTFTPQSSFFESQIGHENLHQWIPQRLGAHGSDPAFYWLSEGFTDYYTHRLLLASGAWTLQQYADALSRQLRGYWQSPARNATAQSIGPRFFSDRDAGKQMYSRGEVLAARWDLALRSSGRSGLDEVMRRLVLPEGRMPTQPANSRVLDALAPLLGDGPQRDVNEFIVEGKDLPLAPDLLGPCFSLGGVDVPRWILGFDPSSIAARKATGVAVGGPAYQAGLREGMELVGWSIFFGEVGKDVLVTAIVDSIKTTMTYRPVDGTRDALPTVTVAADAATDPSCENWIRRSH